MITMARCGCCTVTDREGTVVSFGTCSVCLPVGAISWLIENGRQLDMFDFGAVDHRLGTLREVEGTDAVRGDEFDDSDDDSRNDSGPGEELPDLPF